MNSNGECYRKKAIRSIDAKVKPRKEFINMAQKFPFSMWNYNSPSDFTPDEVNLWADCGMTHPMLPKVMTVDELPTLIPFLDRADELGLKCIICCKELSLIRRQELDISSFYVLGPEGYEELFRRAVELVGIIPQLTVSISVTSLSVNSLCTELPKATRS